MKVRVVLVTENDSPAEVLGENGAEKVKEAWDMFMRLIKNVSDNGDRGYVERVEILED